MFQQIHFTFVEKKTKLCYSLKDCKNVYEKEIKSMSEKREKYVFAGILLISFIAIYIYNLITPRMSDELLVFPEFYHSFWDVLEAQYQQYMDWGGRAVLLLITRIFSLLPKWIFNILNSFCFVYTALLIYWNVDGRKKYDAVLLVLIQLLMWVFSVEFDQTVLWLSGACNYLWGMMLILSFITLYRHLMVETRNGNKIPACKVIGLALSAFVAGWGNENSSGGAILIVGLLTFGYFIEKKRIEKWMLAGLGSAAVGFGLLIFSPGNSVRGQMLLETEVYTGVAALISRGLKVLKAIDAYLLPYLVVICLLGAWYYYEKRKLSEFWNTAVFTVGALATAVVLVAIPEPMPRAYYGANYYMMIAALIMLWKVRDRAWQAVRAGVTLAGVLVFFFVYVEEGANLVRILREVNEREAYILEQKAAGNYDLTLPMLRPQFQSPYSYMYESDISQEEGYWINEVFKQHYALWDVKAVPREEWTEY